jgi:DNA-binding NtrC family response regulator
VGTQSATGRRGEEEVTGPRTSPGAPGRSAAKRVLMVDDDGGSRQGLVALATRWGYAAEEAADGKEALERARAGRPDIVVTDLRMPGFDGLELLRALHDELPSAVVIVLTGHASVETAVAAMKEGAYDYLTKPVDVARLRILLEKAVERADTVREVALLRRQVGGASGIGGLVGASAAMREVFSLIELSAPIGVPVLILGESGTGKELVARTIHERSPRATEPFVAVNCSAVPEMLLESELFGHERGAFTGAAERRPGYFELAHGGTILLDEIAEMSPALQAKYLRVLQDGVFRRVGGTTEITVDVRVIAATNKDPLKAIHDGKFREDLFYRLNVFTIAMPPLRQRKDDIPHLVDAFIREFNVKYGRDIERVDAGALRMLTRHPWPGNVRELRNCVERAVLASPGPAISPDALPFGKGPDPAGGEGIALSLGTTVDEAERELIIRTLASTGNNKTRAADILGISLKTLHNKLNRYALTPHGPA